MTSIETSHDPAEQVAIAQQQGATAREPVLSDDGGNVRGRRSRWVTGTNLAVGVALGVLVMLGLRVVRRHR